MKTKLEKSSHATTTTELVVSIIVNNEEHLLKALAANGSSSSSIFLEACTSTPSSKQMTVIQPFEIPLVVNVLKSKLVYVCDLFNPRV
jgi:hypothetical protein